jgi:hypothetical protein
MPLPNDGVMHDMIMSGSMAAAANPGFFTQEEARATEAIAAAPRGGIDDHRFGDGTQDVDEEEEEQAQVDKDDNAPEPTSTTKGRKKRKKTSPPTEPRVKWTGKEEECLTEAWKTVSMNKDGSGRKYAGPSPRTRTSSTTLTLPPLPRRRATPSLAKRS